VTGSGSKRYHYKLGSTCIKGTIYRHRLRARFWPFQKTGKKPHKTRRFSLSRGFFGLIYAQDTKKPSERYADVWSASIFRGARRKRAQELADGAQGNMGDSREVMNIRQASQYLGVSPDTLYKYVGEQRIPAFKLGNRWRFKKSRLDQWMEEKSSEMEPQAKRKTKAAGKAAGQV
jgi:excisionase family DNA binding protein